MEQLQPNAGSYRQYDQVWQRVAPDLEPYPGWQGQSAGTAPTLPAAPAAAPVSPAVIAPPVQTPPPRPQPQPQPGQLPGAIQNPCCMGTEAADMLEVLTGFIEEELVDRRYFQALARQAPSWARQGLRELAENAGDHAKRLMSAYYMVTGQCYHPIGVSGSVYIGGWCPALRERYHTEACGGLNYARAAEGTTDPCLRQLLMDLSRDEYHHAEVLMEMLQRSL